MRFVIVTGMSGGGKSTAMKMLEDAGYYCADNMPVPLIEKFMELLAMPDNGILKVALGLDVRADQSFEDVNQLVARCGRRIPLRSCSSRRRTIYCSSATRSRGASTRCLSTPI